MRKYLPLMAKKRSNPMGTLQLQRDLRSSKHLDRFREQNNPYSPSSSTPSSTGASVYTILSPRRRRDEEKWSHWFDGAGKTFLGPLSLWDGGGVRACLLKAEGLAFCMIQVFQAAGCPTANAMRWCSYRPAETYVATAHILLEL